MSENRRNEFSSLFFFWLWSYNIVLFIYQGGKAFHQSVISKSYCLGGWIGWIGCLVAECTSRIDRFTKGKKICKFSVARQLVRSAQTSMTRRRLNVQIARQRTLASLAYCSSSLSSSLSLLPILLVVFDTQKINKIRFFSFTTNTT